LLLTAENISARSANSTVQKTCHHEALPAPKPRIPSFPTALIPLLGKMESASHLPKLGERLGVREDSIAGEGSKGEDEQAIRF